MSVRFAPSPTGKFHVGNLRTAWISHTFSQALGMPWIVRFEDIDGPRVVKGALERQLDDLRSLGMVADETVIQSQNHKRHEAFFIRAVSEDQIYPCTCSRKELGQELSFASAPHGIIISAPAGAAPIYSGRCRSAENRPDSKHPTIAWRFKNPDDPRGSLDFVVARTDQDGGNFMPSYHWACALDDFEGRHSLLVRAWDLAQAARFQARVFEWAAQGQVQYPAVFHTSLVVTNDGHRLEKRTRGVTLDEVFESGRTPAELLERLESSFERRQFSEFAPSKFWGEQRETIALSVLGFSD